jgi:DNA polymerase-1
MACALIAIQKQLEVRKLKSKLILQVHDSAPIDVYPGERDQVVSLVREAMEREAPRIAREEYGVDISIPLKCDIKIGDNWGNTKQLEVV